MNTRTKIGSFCLAMAILLDIVICISVGAAADAAAIPGSKDEAAPRENLFRALAGKMTLNDKEMTSTSEGKLP